MKISKEKAVKTAGILVGGAVFNGLISYLTTRYLVKIALDREKPKVTDKVGSFISGSLYNEEFLRRLSAASQKLEHTETEDVRIKAHDGVELVGHLYRCAEPKRIVIAMHGWRATWHDNFGPVSDFFHENDCCVLFAEQRGQNNSGGDYIGFGITERFDCPDWVNWAIENISSTLPIYLCGVSMGATTVLMASGLELPKNVHGIISDCGFTSPNEIWKHILKDNLHAAYRLRLTIAKNLYDKMNRTDEFEYSTMDALRNSKTPVLFIHGTDDHFVPVEMTYRNYCACAAPKRLLIVPGAEHGMSYLADTDGYETVLKNFWQEFDKSF